MSSGPGHEDTCLSSQLRREEGHTQVVRTGPERVVSSSTASDAQRLTRSPVTKDLVTSRVVGRL